MGFDFSHPLKILPLGGALDFVFNNGQRVVDKTFGALLRLLTPKIPTQGTGDPVYSYANSNTYPTPGAPMPLLFGCPPNIYPFVLRRWREYSGQSEINYVYLLICDGPAYNTELRSGSVPVTSLGSVQFQELLPGEAPTLFAPTVWSNPDVSSVELQGGSLDLTPFECNVTFSGSSVTINSDDEPFDGVLPKARFSVSGSASNNGEFVIDTVTDAQHVTVTASLTTETVDCTVNQYGVAVGSKSTWAHVQSTLVEGADEDSPDDINLSFDNGDGTRGLIVGGSGTDDTIYADFRVGDLVQPFRTASNDGADLKVLAISGKTMVVEPAPTAEAENPCALVLVRRQFGPYVSCPQGTTCNRIGINVRFAAGLYRTNKKGKLRTATAGLELQIQAIDDAGNPLDDVVSLGETSFSGRDRTELRYTVWFDVPPARYHVFPARTSPVSDDAGRSDGMTLDAVMGRLVMSDGLQPVEEICTRMMLVITATSALNGADSKINGRWQAMWPTYEEGDWTEPQATNGLAPAWAALRRGRGFAVDTDEYQARDAAWTALGWEYHAYLTGSVTLRDATAELLAAGDATPWYDWRTNQDTVWFDRLRTDPVLMIDDSTRDRSSMKSVPIGLVPEDAPTGVQVTYTDPRTGEDRKMIVGSATAPTPIAYKGVTSRAQAWQLGNRAWGRINYRRTALDPRLDWDHTKLGLGSPVLVQLQEKLWGQFAYLDRYDADGADGFTLVADREFAWDESAQHYVYLPDAAGAPGVPIDCSRGANDRELVLVSTPPGALRTLTDPDEPTHIILGYPGHAPKQTLVAPGIDASDDEVHARVALVLDSPLIFDDPGDPPEDEFPAEGAPPDLDVSDFEVTVDGLTALSTWTPPAAQVAAQVEYRLVGATSWTAVPLVVGGDAQWSLTQSGDYQARVRALGPAGYIGTPSSPVAEFTVASVALSVVLSPTSLPPVVGSSGGMRSATVTPTIIGGTAPYTASWIKDSGDAGTHAENASGPTAILPGFMAPGDFVEWAGHYHVEDALAATADSSSIAVSFYRPYSSGPQP